MSAGGARKGAGRKPLFSARAETKLYAEATDLYAWQLYGRHEGGMQAWIRRALNDATPTAYRVAVLFDGDGSRWVTEDDRELHDVIVEHGGEKTATNDSRDERWQFADQSAIVVSESAWDVGFGWLDDCCCWRGAQTDNEDWGGHNRDCSWSRPTVDLVVGGPSVTPTLQPIVAPCSGTPTSVAAESDSTETLSGPTPARPRTPCSE